MKGNLMKKFYAVLLISVMAFSAKAQTLPDYSSLRNAAECTPRAGLPNFFAKCEAGGTVKAAYFGGSITCQPGWRVQSLEFLRKRYPQTKFEEVFASVGGTGSEFGVFRLSHDVIQYKPDLIFVEFAVNDGQRDPADIIRAMEGIIRNTWAALPDCDICLIYTLTHADWIMKPLKAGKLWRTPGVMEAIADYYGLPSIFMGMDIVRLEKEGKLVMKAPKETGKKVAGKDTDNIQGIPVNPDGKIPFAGDGVHPYPETGHKLYAEAVERSIPKIKTVSGASLSHTPLPPPMNPGYVRNVSFFEVSDARLNGDWSRLDNSLKDFNLYPSIYIPGDLKTCASTIWRAKPGSTFSINFKGKSMLLYFISGPCSGAVEMEIDGKKSKRNLFDEYCHFWRLNPCTPAAGLDQDKIHSFKLSVLPEKIDKKVILAKYGNSKFIDQTPDAFNPTDFFIGGICIEDGTIVK